MKKIKDIEQGMPFLYNDKVLTRGYYDRSWRAYTAFSQNWVEKYLFGGDTLVKTLPYSQRG